MTLSGGCSRVKLESCVYIHNSHRADKAGGNKRFEDFNPLKEETFFTEEGTLRVKCELSTYI